MSTLTVKELSHPAGEVIKIAAGKTLDLKSQGSVTMPTGSVLQVVSNYYATTTTVASSSFVEVTSLTITPSSTSSKVLATVTGGRSAHFDNAVYVSYVAIYRGSTNIAESEIHRRDSGGNTSSGISISKLDSPATTSAVTYKVMVRANTTNSVHVSNSTNGVTVTLMEIQG